jgi:hypothetical protein
VRDPGGARERKRKRARSMRDDTDGLLISVKREGVCRHKNKKIHASTRTMGSRGMGVSWLPKARLHCCSYVRRCVCLVMKSATMSGVGVLCAIARDVHAQVLIHRGPWGDPEGPVG